MRLRITPLAIALATLLALPAIIACLTTSTNAETQASKITYAPIPAGEYKLDPAHSIIGFSIRHLEINWVEGRFKDFTGVITYDDKDVTKSTVDFTARVESIDTGVEPRNAHLRTADFFDAAKYPEMTFKSTSIQHRGNEYILRGDLTIKGVSKPVTLPFSITGAIRDPWGNTRFGIEAQTKINRRDFGINYGNPLSGGGFDVGDEVSISLHLEAVKPEKKQ